MIIIIGAIALIVSPIILNMIGKSKKATFTRSIDGLVDVVRIDHHDDDFKAPREYFYNQGELTLLTVNNKERNESIETNGRIDGNGFIYVDEDGRIRIDNVCDKEYCANGETKEIDIIENGSGTIPEVDKEDPMIILNGDSTVYIEIGGTYQELGAIAQTKSGKKLEYTAELRLNGSKVDSIDTSREDVYQILYQTSNNNKIASVIRTVAVLNMQPVITMTESSDTYDKEKEVLINVSGVKPNTVESFTYEIKKDNESIKTETVHGLTKTILLNETGVYEVIVTAIDDHHHTSTVSRIYKIDTTKPSITVPENTVIKITEVTGYDLMTGVVISDNSGETAKVEIRGSLTAILGEQTVTYKVIDQAGNVETAIRRFTIVEAEGPILNFNNASTGDIWTQAQTIIVTATDNSNLKTFTYEVMKDSVSKGIQNVKVSGKSAEASVPLNESGIYSIKLTGIDEYGNSNTLSSGEYKIDVMNPIVGSVTPSGTMGSNGWYTSDVTFNVINGTDSLSGHKSTIVLPTSITSNTTGSNVVVTTEDNAGNKATKTFGPYKIDKTKPTFTVKSTANETITKGANNVIQSTYFNIPTWSISGTGSIVCKDGNTTVTNTSSLEVGTHTVTCTATGLNGLSSSASKTIIVSLIKGWVVADTNNHGSIGNVPNLNGLIPVKYRDENDMTTKWYDYSKQMWANAVSVSEEYRNSEVGTEIPESAINAYFVWIPRYEYNYISISNYAGGTKYQPGGISINFIAKTKISPSTNYKIHPAFTFGTTQLSGIWIGKFKTTGEVSMPTIKPNLDAFRYQNIGAQFTTAQKFSEVGNSYGISTSADAHMMKNSEWGAVAYLSQSKYGKYGNSSYSGADKEVYINNYWSRNNYVKTGCSAGVPSTKSSSSCAYTYEKSPGGTGASTTGTIYGIYDMSSATGEQVMGVYKKNTTNTSKGHGFSTMPDEKYYDNYISEDITTACNNGICYGQALSETSGWYSDRENFIVANKPWLNRGGQYSSTTTTDSGIFGFGLHWGDGTASSLYRVAMIG